MSCDKAYLEKLQLVAENGRVQSLEDAVRNGRSVGLDRLHVPDGSHVQVFCNVKQCLDKSGQSFFDRGLFGLLGAR